MTIYPGISLREANAYAELCREHGVERVHLPTDLWANLLNAAWKEGWRVDCNGSDIRGIKCFHFSGVSFWRKQRILKPAFT